MFSCGLAIILCVGISTMFCKSELHYSFCFPYVDFLTIFLLTLYQIYTVRYTTIQALINFPVCTIYLDGLYFFYKWTSWTIFIAFFHASLSSGGVQLRISWHLCPNEMIFYISLPPKSSKRWLCVDLSKVWVLGDHGAPVFCLECLYGWHPWVISCGKNWSSVFLLF